MGKDEKILPGPEDEVREEEGQQERPAADATVVSGQGDDTIGQYGRGNIDLYNRPQYKNEDGRISTVRSMSANIDGKEVLLPTVSRDQNGNPILLSNDEAIQRYRDTGEHLGIFDTVDEANSYAENLHKQQEKYYAATNQDDSVNQREIAEGPEGGTTPVTRQQQQITTPSTHLYDWGGQGVTLDSVLHGEGKDKPMSQVINDYYLWAGENGITPNVLDIMEAMKDKDVSKSADWNEQDEKKRLNKEKWDKVGNFLTHLGNAVGTLAGGGHAPLKLEDPVQWTERQRKLRDATLAHRNAYNQSVFAMQAKAADAQRAADMAKQKVEIDKRKLDQADARLYLQEQQFEWKKQLDQNKFDLQKEKQKVWQAVQEGRLSNEAAKIVISRMNAETNRYKAENPVQTTTTEETPFGTKKKTTTSSRGNGGSNDYSQYKVQNGGGKDYSRYKVQK